MKIPSMLTLADLERESKTPVGRYAERFHHRPPLWYYRWMSEEEIDEMCLRALEDDKPVPGWAITKYGSWAWNEPPGEMPPAGMRF